jgi:hypothetical protein
VYTGVWILPHSSGCGCVVEKRDSEARIVTQWAEHSAELCCRLHSTDVNASIAPSNNLLHKLITLVEPSLQVSQKPKQLRERERRRTKLSGSFNLSDGGQHERDETDKKEERTTTRHSSSSSRFKSTVHC